MMYNNQPLIASPQSYKTTTQSTTINTRHVTGTPDLVKSTKSKSPEPFNEERTINEVRETMKESTLKGFELIIFLPKY